MLLQDRTRIDAPAADVFAFFHDMASHYTDWHPDHIAFEWVAGDDLAPGTVFRFEERIGGHRQNKKVRITRVVPDRYLEFAPLNLVVRLLMPRLSFAVEPLGDSECELVAEIFVRTGPVGAWLNRREFDAVRQHMREEGQNLKDLVESSSRENRRQEQVVAPVRG